MKIYVALTYITFIFDFILTVLTVSLNASDLVIIDDSFE